MEPLDPAWVEAQLSTPPFVTIEGVSNARSLGSYPSTSLDGRYTKPNFRAGEISGMTPNGRAQLEVLGIKKVFDLRSDVELQRFGGPPPELGSKVEIQRIPVFKDGAYSPEMLAQRSKLYKSGTVESLMEVYFQILEDGAVAFNAIFKHIRDRPDDAFLFHCTAGKDRTGVLAALLLKVAGVEDGTIAKDYELTRVGREHQRAATMAKLAQMPDYANNKEGILNMLSSRHESMIAFLQRLEEQYGGVESYLKDRLGLSAVDVANIRNNLVTDAQVVGPASPEYPWVLNVD